MAGGAGQPWRIAQGIVRLNIPGPSGVPEFGSLAVAGDIIGCETLMTTSYAFSAAALTVCELVPWPEGPPNAGSLLESLARAQQRAAEVVALRSGQGAARILALIRLIAGSKNEVVLPPRQDIADITALRFETVSRIIKQLERARVLNPFRREGVRAARGFRLDWNSLPVETGQA